MVSKKMTTTAPKTAKALDLIPTLKAAIAEVDQARDAVENNIESGAHIAWLLASTLEERIDDVLIITNRIERALLGETD